MTTAPTLAMALATALALSGCGGGSSASGDPSDPGESAAGEPQSGGELTVLQDAGFAGSWPTGLDPASNLTGGANLDMNQAIFGGLFLLEADDDGSNARIEPNQAESLELSDDGMTMTVKLREGIEFSDGTPLDAEAVVWNWQRDLQSTCACKPRWPLAGNPDDITATDPLTVVVQFNEPFGAVEANFPVSNVNWIASPTAVQAQGEEDFAINPVGAGPFTVVSNQLNSTLELTKNPNYFKEGLPYLDALTFQTVGGDQPAYQALLAGQAQAYNGLSTTPLLDQAQQNDQLQVTVQPATSPYVIQLNTRTAPFDDERARQAIYAATDWDAIATGLFQGKYEVSQSFTAPGGKFHEPEVDGYQGYDPELAEQLVQELGGIDITLGTTGVYVAEQVMTALQTQWQEVGITVNTESLPLSGVIDRFTSGNWTAMLQTAGAWDPAAGVGVSLRFDSESPFSGVTDPQLDELLAEAASATDADQRGDLYQQAAELLAANHYAPFGLAFAPANVALEDVHGPGLTTSIPALAVNTNPLWDRVWTTRD
ncbi:MULTISPECIES: ABC transporter substrate-binding protein [unclassified Modestobacter]